MIVEKNGVKYVKLGRMEITLSAVQGKSLSKLEKMFPDMRSDLLELLSKEVSPKTEKASKKEDKK